MVPRPFSALILVAWLGQMGVLIDRAYLRSTPGALAAELGRYGAGAQWKGVYYRGEKIGFTVGQTIDTGDGYELQEDGRLQMVLLGATSAARIKTSARVDRAFALRSFSFSLDPGSGPIEVRGSINGSRLELTIHTASGVRSETRDLSEPPNLSLNLPRRLAAAGLSPGQRLTVATFDPATLRNAPMDLEVQAREVVWAAGKPVPAFRIRMTFSGVTSTSWVTDVGEVVREESPLGLIVRRESRDEATAIAVPGDVQVDMLSTAAITPSGTRIVDPASVESLRLRVEGVELTSSEVDGSTQTLSRDVIDLRDPRTIAATAMDPKALAYLAPEAFIESDDLAIRTEAQTAAAGATDPRLRAERLVRYVNALLEKKPTVSLPSASEVLRTKVGDCNEHSVLFVAMARALGIPSRIAVGLVFIHGGFYYHAWAEVYIEGPAGRG
ncbi:MAG: transglutaminase-like domain-containing protein, partial [Thermoplasmata archaeon]|nr:transglutaminase-like domain-containing protein [Thermoplasmata archaeon]